MNMIGDATNRKRRTTKLAALLRHSGIQRTFDTLRDSGGPSKGSPDQVHKHVSIRRTHLLERRQHNLSPRSGLCMWSPGFQPRAVARPERVVYRLMWDDF